MLVRPLDAPASKLSIHLTPESAKRRQLGRVPPHRSKIVSYDDSFRQVEKHQLSTLELFSNSSVGNISTTRSKLGRDDIKWQELLTHFRMLQSKHEKARRQAMGAELGFERMSVNMGAGASAAVNGDKANTTPGPSGSMGAPPSSGPARPPMRRKVTGSGSTGPGAGGDSMVARPPSRIGPILSPLNPRARGQSTTAPPVAATAMLQPPGSPTSSQTQQAKRRTLGMKP